jgi:hypothetical protein
LRPLSYVVRDRSERCPGSIGMGTLASDADAIGSFLATVKLTARALMVRMVGPCHLALVRRVFERRPDIRLIAFDRATYRYWLGARTDSEETRAVWTASRV